LGRKSGKKIAKGACVRKQILSHCGFAMEREWRYRGRTITAADLTFIHELIAAHPQASRCELSRRLCEAWNWKQTNGTPRDMVCRGMLLMLDRAGQIELPAMRFRPLNPLAVRVRPEPLVPDNRPVQCTLQQILSLEIEQVRRSADEPMFNSLMEQLSLSGLRTTGGRALEVCGENARPGDRLSGLVECTAASGQPRPVHRLGSTSAAAQHPFDCL
jgi:hypothetical protein